MIAQAPSLYQLLAYFLKLGATGFGGPVALANYMRRDLVDTHAWISEEEFGEGIAIATACPGPLAYQLGVYCGFVLHGVGGALGVAVAFAIAPFLIVVGAAYFYVHFAASWQLRALFYGVGPVVVALILKSCWDLGRKTLHSDKRAWTFAAVACVITVAVQKELTAVFVLAGILGAFAFATKSNSSGSSEPTHQVTRAKDVSTLLSVATSMLPIASSKLFFFFFKTGLLVFGSGLVVVPFLKAYVVDQYHWLDNRAFLDSVAIGMMSPGPVVITSTFVGYLLNSFSGAVAATVGMFLPSVLFTIIGTPILRRHRKNSRVQGFVRGITVAVVGVLAGTAWLIVRSIIGDVLTAVLLLAALLVVTFWKNVREPVLVLCGAMIGLLAYPLLHPVWMLK
ncbi:MAG: chromate efflux transporter [Candidatus Baltobacteraceae bacterium]